MAKARPVIISIKDLVKTFGSSVAVDHISFDVRQGEFTGLVGPNGAGKTTTIQMILDVITPTSGTIEIFGQDMRTSREDILGRMGFSSAYVAMPSNLKVIENLKVFARLYGVKDRDSKITELVNFFGIEELLPKMTSDLSTGQLTRINLAKALLNDPELLLLDEPTSSLDPFIAEKTRQLLKKIQKERDVTILYTTHNMAEIEELCERVLFIQEGRIVDDASPKALIKKYGRKDMNDVFLAIAQDGEERAKKAAKKKK